MPWKSTKKKPFWLSRFFWSFSKVCCFCAFVWGIRLKNKRLLSQTRQNRIFGSHLGRVYSFGSTSIFTSFKSQCFLRKPAVYGIYRYSTPFLFLCQYPPLFAIIF